MGKPNPAKMGNFLEVDVFVLIACPENSLIDSRDFMKPIVTPLELEIALKPDSRQWDGRLSCLFSELLSFDNEESDLEVGEELETAVDHLSLTTRRNNHVIQYSSPAGKALIGSDRLSIL